MGSILGLLISGNSHIPCTTYHIPYTLYHIQYAIFRPLISGNSFLANRSFGNSPTLSRPTNPRSRCWLGRSAVEMTCKGSAWALGSYICLCVYIYVHIYIYIFMFCLFVYLYLSIYLYTYTFSIYKCLFDYIYTYLNRTYFGI